MTKIELQIVQELKKWHDKYNSTEKPANADSVLQDIELALIRISEKAKEYTLEEMKKKRPWKIPCCGHPCCCNLGAK